ncbi:abortive infection protein, partial [Micromonospora deserti]
HPHSPDPRLDLDTASMAIVKTIRDDFADPASTYRVEPKESYHAIADHYAHLGFQAARR